MSAVLRLRSVGSGLCIVKRTASLCATSGQKTFDYVPKSNHTTKAVIFDMGGVILPSPFPFFREYESQLGLPNGILGRAVVAGGSDGAWQQLERGEISLKEFAQKFSHEVTSISGIKKIDLSQMMGRLADSVIHATPNPELIDAIRCLRAEGIKTALLTNNFEIPGNRSYQPLDDKLFDLIVESVKVKMRKPEPRIFHYTLDKLQVAPQEAVFLDDLGENLKSARELGLKTIKVVEAKQAVKDLEEVIGFQLKGFCEGTSRIPERLEIPLDKLRAYMEAVLNIYEREEPVVRCFDHGQSNPTYFVQYANRKMVLRKKPPGKLLPSAHAVEREYLVMKALGENGVPVPKMLCLCLDSSVLGTPFYLMEYIGGRVFKDALLPGLSNDERRAVYMALLDVLVKIHKVDIKKAGLEKYGKQGEFVKRNFARWSKQYEASKTKDNPSMDELMKWLNDNMPTNELCTVIHGDFRLDNLIFHPTKPEVLAVIDWELSTLGDPLTDLANLCLKFYTKGDVGFLPSLGGMDVQEYGIPTVSEIVGYYSDQMGIPDVSSKWPLYAAFACFRMAAILQGVYKRFTIGQASSPNAQLAESAAEMASRLGLEIALTPTGKLNKEALQAGVKHQKIDPFNKTSGDHRKFSTLSSASPDFHNTSGGNPEHHKIMTSKSNQTFRIPSANEYSTSHDRDIPGGLPLSVSALSPHCQNIHRKVKEFIAKNILPFEREYFLRAQDPKTKWSVHPKMEELKAKAKAEGLWNLFLPKESDPEGKYGAGLSNIEYAFIAEEMGKSMIGSEPFNCSAPDTGNMEVLVRYGTEEHKEKWLKPLLEGKIRSCFAMTEPGVASSDATNIQASIRREGNEYVIDGHKWWTSGAMDPRCKVAIFMGKTNTSGPVHHQQSMIIVPMDAPGVKIVRPLTVFGYDDAPHGHAEVLFENVRVPVSNLLLGEGRGFEIAQGRLGPGRIHHCMRTIGMTERALAVMVNRAQNRVAFGKPLVQQSTIQQEIAKSRVEIEQSRLLVLKAAYMMDTVGNKVAAPEIAMIKASVPKMASDVIDRAIQVHGGMGVCQDSELPSMYAWSRVLRIADGPDEVHYRAIAKMELRTQNLARL